jgi:hypothetical protein
MVFFFFGKIDSFIFIVNSYLNLQLQSERIVVVIKLEYEEL